jgi:basic amino acid/polyamine antiporter, APA family
MENELRRELGLTDAVAVVIGTVIGSGIFLVPNLVAHHLPSPATMLAMWIFSGLLSFCGALAYAELGAMLPETGGQYVYLRESYGALMAFLCGWTYFFVIVSGAIAWLAISFSLYLSYFVTLSVGPARLLAVVLIALITYANYRGVVLGAAVQKTFTLLKMLGLALLIGAAFMSHTSAAAAPARSSNIGDFGVAMIACLLAYDGWVAISFVAGEVRNPRRNIPLALAIGLGACMLIYVLANLAYLKVLGPSQMAASQRVGALAAERTLGPGGGAVVALIVMISIVGAANGWVLTAPRIYFAQARDALFFRGFAEVHPRFHTPSVAIAMQGVWAGVLAVTGTYENLTSYVMFAAWLFYGLTAAGVLILRRKYPAGPRPYRMLGYPVTLLLFLAVAAGFVVSTAITSPGPSLTGILLIATGVPAYYLWRRRLIR